MRRFWVLLVAGLAGLMLSLSPATPALADDDDVPSSWAVDDYQVHASARSDGSLDVTLDLAFDFSNDKGHGPFVTLPLRQRVADNPDLWRVLDVELGQVTSPSGADATVQTTEQDDALLIRIGDPDKQFTGVQTYRLNYTLRGLISPNNPESHADEVNWNVVGTGWQVPIRKAGVTLTGPDGLSSAKCWQGAGYRDPCAASQVGTSAVYGSNGELDKGEGMQIVGFYPAGTFTNADPRFEKRYHAGNLFPANPLSLSLTAALSVLGVGLVAMRSRRREEAYAGITPGLTPRAGGTATMTRRTTDEPVAVAFTPPKGATPGEIGTLIDATADNKDVTATIIDLAARGFLTIENLGGDPEGKRSKKKDLWRLNRTGTALPDTKPERHLLKELFQESDQVTTKELRKEKYQKVLPGTRDLLYKRVSSDLGWFRSNPETARAIRIGIGLALIGAGVALGFLLGFAAGLGLVGIGLILTGIAVIVTLKSVERRTAQGNAVLAQAKGFREYLTTAEADQIRFEEGIDVFSRYLPYAIVFGVAERWVKIFQQLAAEGRYDGDMSWCMGHHVGYGFSGFTDSITSMTDSMSSAMQASTAAGSSGSGGGGGGGFGGGGGGGW